MHSGFLSAVDPVTVGSKSNCRIQTNTQIRNYSFRIRIHHFHQELFISDPDPSFPIFSVENSMKSTV